MRGHGKAQACIACHGADLRGVGPIPPLAGRSPTYMVREMLLFDIGGRRNALALPMRQEVSHLSVRDMISAAAYIASLGEDARTPRAFQAAR